MSDAALLQPSCPPLHRPEALFATGATVQGLRAAQVQVSGGVRTLGVWLFQDPPPALADPAAWTLTAAHGVAPVAIASAVVQGAPTPHIELTLTGAPDPTLYRLEVVDPPPVAFDPLRVFLPVRLRPDCDALGSCITVPPAPVPPAPSPVHDYLARDWRSLRQALLEFLIQERPEADLSAADPTVTLLELFAHVGDLLHYRLDRVATEAYLETARLRTSVRRHARLVDYPLGEAVSARTFVHVQVAPGSVPVPVPAGAVARDAPGSDLAFTTEAALTARAERGEIPIYDWGEEACCLPEGATECVLVRPLPADAPGAWIGVGDLLVFEVVDPIDRVAHQRWATRQQAWPIVAPADAFRDPLASRAAQVVRLTAVDPFVDPLLGAGLPLFRVAWSREDALVRSYAVGIDTGEGADEVTIARANLVPAHHGVVADPGGLAARPGGGYSLTSAGDPSRGGPGLALDETGRPHRLEVDVTLPSGLAAGAEWVETLLDPEASSSDFPFVVDSEEHEPPVLRFRTGAVGLDPPGDGPVAARYEVGGGVIGNVPANALHELELGAIATIAARNPTAATGGVDRMPLAVARRDAPEAFAAAPKRAVIPADYAAAADEEPIVTRAVARRTWSGSWPLITTVVDLDVDSDEAEQEALAALAATLDGSADARGRVGRRSRHAGGPDDRARGVRRARLRSRAAPRGDPAAAAPGQRRVARPVPPLAPGARLVGVPLVRPRSRRRRPRGRRGGDDRGAPPLRSAGDGARRDRGRGRRGGGARRRPGPARARTARRRRGGARMSCEPVCPCGCGAPALVLDPPPPGETHLRRRVGEFHGFVSELVATVERQTVDGSPARVELGCRGRSRRAADRAPVGVRRRERGRLQRADGGRDLPADGAGLDRPAPPRRARRLQAPAADRGAGVGRRGAGEGREPDGALRARACRLLRRRSGWPRPTRWWQTPICAPSGPR